MKNENGIDGKGIAELLEYREAKFKELKIYNNELIKRINSFKELFRPGSSEQKLEPLDMLDHIYKYLLEHNSLEGFKRHMMMFKKEIVIETFENYLTMEDNL